MRSDFDDWQDGDPLSSAWFLRGPEALKDQYRDAGSDQRTVAIQALLQGELKLALARSDLRALGVKVQPDTMDVPSRVPPTFFESSAAVIDWEKGTVEFGPTHFLDVRVARDGAPLDEGACELPAVSLDPTPRRGRKPLRPLFEEAYEFLLQEDDHFADRALEKQTVAVQLKVRELHPGRFPGGSVPGRSTVYRFLQSKRSSR